MKPSDLNRRKSSLRNAWQSGKETIKFAISSPWLWFGIAFGAVALQVAAGIDYRQTHVTAQRVVCNGVAFTIKVDRQYPQELVCELVTEKICQGEQTP